MPKVTQQVAEREDESRSPFPIISSHINKELGHRAAGLAGKLSIGPLRIYCVYKW